MKKYKVLLVEDNNLFAKTLVNSLSDEYIVDNVSSVQEATNVIKNGYDIFVLDVMLSDKNGVTGLDLCKTIRREGLSNPILITTIREEINSKLDAFKYGADDYLCKPFNILELKARLKALIRRIPIKKVQNRIVINDIEINIEGRTVTKDNKLIDLRKKEFDLLKHLVINRGRVLTRNMLINTIWPNKDLSSNTVDVHIKHLRNKLSDPSSDGLIKTIYGLGYKIE